MNSETKRVPNNPPLIFHFMPHDDELTLHFRQMAAGDDLAAERLWNEYFAKLVLLAQRNLGSLPTRSADEEDVALSAMNSFMRVARQGRLQDAANRDELWKLLVTFTLRKISKQKKYQTAQKRGGGKVRGESVFLNAAGEEAAGGLGQIPAEPDAEFADDVTHTCRELIDQLEESLQLVARMKLEGLTNAEIAGKLDIVERTVEQKLNRIRLAWSEAE